MNKVYEQAETGCCPRFNPEPWEEKEITWQDNLFIKDHVRSFLHIPLGMGKVMTKNMEMIQAADALAPEPLMLSDENSLWGSDIYIAVSKEVPQAENVRISGTFLTKVFEGPYKNAGKWVKEMKAYVKAKSREMKKMYFFYTTCPACAKVYGKNYTVILAMVQAGIKLAAWFGTKLEYTDDLALTRAIEGRQEFQYDDVLEGYFAQ